MIESLPVCPVKVGGGDWILSVVNPSTSPLGLRKPFCKKHVYEEWCIKI